MLNLKEIERNILGGFVLDWSGNWRPVSDVVEEESDYLHHLENGEIVDSGRWVKIDDLLKVDSPEAKIDDKETKIDVDLDHLKTKVIHSNLQSVSDAGDKTSINKMKEESKGRKARERDIKREAQKTKEDSEKETRELEAVEKSKKEELQTDSTQEKVDSFEAILPREESKDGGKLDTKALKIARAKESPSAQSKLPDKKEVDSSSDWDKARSIKSKLIILPIVGVIVIVIVIIIIILL